MVAWHDSAWQKQLARCDCRMLLYVVNMFNSAAEVFDERHTSCRMSSGEYAITAHELEQIDNIVVDLESKM